MRLTQGHVRTQRRMRQREGTVTYRYRGWACNIRPHHLMWYVAGMDGTGGGILEWCTDKEDAQSRMRIMKTFPQFKNLRIGSNVEDDTLYATRAFEQMESSKDISRAQYQRGISQCLQMISNLRKWTPPEILENPPSNLESHITKDAYIALLKENNLQKIRDWRGVMRKMRAMYHSPENTLFEKRDSK